MVSPLEQAVLALMIFAIMLGMGASLTPRDFYLALRRPYGLMIGLVSQYGFMPFIGFMLATLLTVPEAIALGIFFVMRTRPVRHRHEEFIGQRFHDQCDDGSVRAGF